MTTAPRCLELFAGAGGAALGLGAAGLEHAGLCEWDPSACATLRAAGLGPVIQGDVRDRDAIAAVAGERVDVLWSSFPCQAWSTAGKRRGAADDRNGWPWTVDAIDRFGPSWFLGENVRGLLLHVTGCTASGGQAGLFGTAPAEACPGCYFERVILPDLRRRFAFAGWWLLDAADYGVPQHRRRVILWAGPRPLEAPKPTHGPGRALPWVSMGEALGLEGVVQSGVCDSSCETRGVPRETSQPAPTVPVSSHLYLEAWEPMRADSGDRGRAPLAVEGPAPTITANAGHPQAWTCAGVPYLSRPSPTVSAVGEQKGSGPGGSPEKMQRASDALYLGTGRRRLTVAECARLQDFPADHPWQGGVGAQYRQVGNAVPPRLAEEVGRALLAVMVES
jgi:DNA (cytosine-5)-methyltransferase 1